MTLPRKLFLSIEFIEVLTWVKNDNLAATSDYLRNKEILMRTDASFKVIFVYFNSGFGFDMRGWEIIFLDFERLVRL